MGKEHKQTFFAGFARAVQGMDQAAQGPVTREEAEIVAGWRRELLVFATDVVSGHTEHS